jgi:CelD/BcsL family acetyltransferase involved in cellulose biosynthesis
MPGFHEHIVRQAQAAGILHISELKFGDTVVSRHLGFYYCNRFYWYMPVYDPVYQNYSPGKIHLYLCILDAITRNGEIFDFLRGVEEYKLQWTEQVSQLYELSLCGRTAGSVIRLAFAESVKPVLQELRIKLYSVKL